MASTPAEWLPILTKRLDDEQPRVRRLKRYVTDDAPLPEMGPNTRAAWERFQRKARTNLALLIIESVADRIIPNGIEVGGSTNSDVAQRAQRIWRDNRMDLVFKEWIRFLLIYRIGYLCVWRENGLAVITAESPEFMYAETDPLRPWLVRAAIKVWRDTTVERDYCYVWVPGGRQRFSRASRVADKRGTLRLRSRTGSTDWAEDGEFEAIDGDIPIYPGENPGGAGEFELHTDLIDRINLGTLQRLVTTAMQAFRQRALKRKAEPDSFDDPDQDEAGDDVDLAKIFEHAPGALWDLPEGMELWESQVTDINPMLNAEKADRRELSAVTRTPLPALLPDSANQSASGVDAAKEGLVFKARDRIAVAQIVLAAVLLKALRVEETDVTETITVLCEPPDRVSMSEKYSAAAQAKAAGESWASIARNILGYSPDQIAQDALDRAEEQLAAATFAGMSSANTNA